MIKNQLITDLTVIGFTVREVDTDGNKTIIKIKKEVKPHENNEQQRNG